MTDFAVVLALIVSFVAAFITYWQTKLVRQSIESQTFTTLLERAREIDMSSTLDFIGTLKFSKYTSFQKSVPPERQAEIRAVVDFYNDLSHMIRSKYIDDFYPIRVYHPGLLLCFKKLLPWWLDGIRATRYPLLYDNFKWLCQYASFLENEMTRKKLPDIPQIGYRKYLKSQKLDRHSKIAG